MYHPAKLFSKRSCVLHKMSIYNLDSLEPGCLLPRGASLTTCDKEPGSRKGAPRKLVLVLPGQGGPLALVLPGGEVVTTVGRCFPPRVDPLPGDSFRVTSARCTNRRGRRFSSKIFDNLIWSGSSVATSIESGVANVQEVGEPMPAFLASGFE